MRDYETIVIVKPDATDTVIKGLAKKLEKVLEGKPGKIVKRDDWGIKRLAYPINKEKKARYLYWQYAQAPHILGQVDRALRFDENVMRYMTVTIGEHGKVKKVKIEKTPKKVERVSEEEEGERRMARPVKIDYKDPVTLAPFVTERGKIVPQRNSRMSAKDHRSLAQAIKRSRHLALLSYTTGFSMSSRETPTEGYAP